MKHGEKSIVHSGFFAFRTPLLPFDDLLKWSDGLEAAGRQSEEAILSDRKKLRARLQAIIERPEVREAIFLASRDLDRSINEWIQNPGGPKGTRTERSLVRYFLRMTCHTIPFGLFAANSTGNIGNQTRLILADQSKYKRHTRLDFDYLWTLIDQLIQDRSLRRNFIYRPNTSLYRTSSGYRYHELQTKGSARSYHLVSVVESDELSATLNRAAGGASFEALASPLLDADVSTDDAENFLHELIDCRMLVPQIPFPVHGPEPLQLLIEELGKHRDTYEFSVVLSKAREELERLDSKRIGADQKIYEQIARQLEALPAKVEPARMFQVDLVKPAPEASLDERVINNILEGVDILRLLGHVPPESASLKRFRQAFTARYEMREVPLLEALDEEAGIGFQGGAEPVSLLQNLPFITNRPGGTIPWGMRENFLLTKLTDALRNADDEIVLNDADLEPFRLEPVVPFCDAFAVSAVLAAERVVLESAYGPSGARLLGRFCHADPELRVHVERHLRAEEALELDAIFAEIVYLPQGRVGNILSRPAMRIYEIPYLSFSYAKEEHQIPAGDLLVSVRDDRILLRSARLNRRVIPRLTNAHRYPASSLGIYRFLGELQNQGRAGNLRWNWGPLRQSSYLPRVVYKNVVLSVAQWRLRKQQVQHLIGLRDLKLFQEVQTWRKSLHLPRWILFVDDDSRLPFDLENILCIETLTHLMKEAEEVILSEFYPLPADLCAQSAEGRFIHELIIPLVRTKDAQDTVSRTVPSPLPAIQRSFPPGSEWSYVKLYTGTATADSVLLALWPFIQDLSESQKIDRWFFIRYGDPDWHLRLRFHGPGRSLQTSLLQYLQDSLAPLLNGSIRRIQFDTYDREVERYGGDQGILIAEKIFHVDSECVMKILELPEAGDDLWNERWRLALLGIDWMLNDLGLDLQKKHLTIQRVKESFMKEFEVEEAFRRKLAEKFRTERKEIETIFSVSADDDHPLSPGIEILRGRSGRLQPLVQELRNVENAGLLTDSIPELATSFIHMHVNRLLRSAHREQELVLYDWLTQFYHSCRARNKS